MAICSISIKIKVSWWVQPLIKTAAVVHRVTGWPRSAEGLARFIAQHGVSSTPGVKLTP